MKAVGARPSPDFPAIVLTGDRKRPATTRLLCVVTDPGHWTAVAMARRSSLSN
jgi:hypothetical protein